MPAEIPVGAKGPLPLIVLRQGNIRGDMGDSRDEFERLRAASQVFRREGADLSVAANHGLVRAGASVFDILLVQFLLPRPTAVFGCGFEHELGQAIDACIEAR